MISPPRSARRSVVLLLFAVDRVLDDTFGVLPLQISDLREQVDDFLISVCLASYQQIAGLLNSVVIDVN
jgi:hypothetical protein